MEDKVVVIVECLEPQMMKELQGVFWVMKGI